MMLKRDVPVHDGHSSSDRDAFDLVDDNFILFVASYIDVATVLADYRRIEDAQTSDDCVVEASVVLSRGGSGRVIVSISADRLLRTGPLLRRDAALVIGLFAPSLLLASAVDIGVGPAIGDLVRKHDQGKFGAGVEECLPPRASAIVAIVEPQHLRGVEVTLSHAWKNMNTAIDWDDYHAVQQVLLEADIRSVHS